MSATSAPHYKAFISYSHADNREVGRKWADWLHHELETYQVPHELAGQPNQYGQTVPTRIYPVFQDEKELSANADLSASLQDALDRSEFLIYLSSPRSARSVYVQEEIKHFKQTGRGGKIIALILRGEPEYGSEQTEAQCFPDALRFGVTAEGQIDYGRHEEALAADVRLPHSSEEGFTSPEHYRRHLQAQQLPKAQIRQQCAEYGERLQLAKLKIIATILGVPLNELTRRDQAYQLERMKRKNRNIKRVAGVVSVLALLAAAAGIYAWQQKNLSQQHLAQSLYASGISKLAQNEYGEPAAYIAAAVRNGSATARQFAESMLAAKDDRVLLPDTAANHAAFSPDGRWLAGFADQGNGRFVLQWWDTRTRQPVSDLATLTTRTPARPLFDQQGRLYANSDGEIVRLHTDRKQSEVLYRAAAADGIQLAAVSPDGQWLALRHYDPSAIELVRSGSSEPGRPIPIDPAANGQIVFAPDSLRAVVWQQDDAGSRGEIIRLDDGGSAVPFATPARATQARFADDGRQLVLFDSRQLVLLDTASGHSQLLDGRDTGYVWVGFNPDQRTLLAMGNTGYAVYRRDNGRLQTTQVLSLGPLLRAIAPDAELSPDQTQQITTLNKQTYLQNLGSNNLLIGDLHLAAGNRQIVADPDGRHLWVLAAEGRHIDRIQIETQSRETGKIRLPETAAYIRVLDNGLLMAVSPQKTVRFYDPASGQPVGQAVATEARMININREQTRFLARTGDNSFGIWNIRDGSRVLHYRHPQALGNFTTDESFRYLLMTDERRWQLLDPANGKPLLSGDQGLSNAVFSPDGRWMALANTNGQTDVYRLDTLKRQFSLPTAATPILRFSPDGEILLAAHDTKRLRLWHTATGQTYGQSIPVLPDTKLLAFSADSQRLFLQDYIDGQLTPSVKIIDTASGNLSALPLAPGLYHSLQLVGGEQRIAGVERLPEGSRVKIWQIPGGQNLPPEQLAADLEAFYGRKYDPQTGAIDHYRAASQPFNSWYFQNIYTRPVAPGADTTVVDAISRLSPVPNNEALQQLGGTYFYHPLAKAALAEYFARQPDTRALAGALARLAERQLAQIDNEAVRQQVRQLLAAPPAR